MFSNLFGSKKKEETDSALPLDLSFIGTDIHSHFIPGIDDGARTTEDSLALIRRMMEMGYKRIVTTPHINYDHYPNTNEKIMDGLDVLKAALEENKLDIQVRAAAEYFIDDHFIQLLDAGIPLLTISNRQVLVECSFSSKPLGLYDILFQMQASDYRPVIAHPERYMFYHEHKSSYQGLKEKGCLLQLNLLSLVGYYGNEIRQVAEYLLDKGLYDYCGTDMHHLKHADALQKLPQSKFFSKLQRYPFLNSTMEI